MKGKPKSRFCLFCFWRLTFCSKSRVTGALKGRAYSPDGRKAELGQAEARIRSSISVSPVGVGGLSTGTIICCLPECM